MPLHDWTRVESWLYHQQQLGWVCALSDWLNHNLPPDRYALTEYGFCFREPGDECPRVPDELDEEGHYYHCRRTIGIRCAGRHDYAGMVELVSPGVKSRRQYFEAFVGKVLKAVRRGLHVLLIDPFPPNAINPHGLHAAIWKELTGNEAIPDGAKPLTVASYVAEGSGKFAAHVEPTAVGDVLPDMPLFLDPSACLSVPLESTYQSAWNGFPRPLRGLVEPPAA